MEQRLQNDTQTHNGQQEKYINADENNGIKDIHIEDSHWEMEQGNRTIKWNNKKQTHSFY